MASRVFPYSVTVTLLRRTVSGQDEYGNDTYDSTPVDIPFCVVAPGGSSENTQWTDQVSTAITVFFPYGTAVSPYDGIMYRGVKYEIEGMPQEWEPSPFSGNTAPIQVRASVVTGASV